MAITTLFFDLDGTISNNLLGIHRCLNHAFEQLGAPQISMAQTLPLVGPPFRESIPRLYPELDVERAILAYRERYDQLGWLENELYDGVSAAIRQLHLQGFTIVLCTSKPRVFAEKIVTHFDLARYFDGIHGPELDGRFDKKDELLAHLVSHYGVPSRNALMIGDRDKDIQAAHHAGTHSLGVLWGFGSKVELDSAGAAKTVEHPPQLQHTIHSFE